MAEPKSVEELSQKFMDNTKYSGRFLETKIHMPCGFCAEPDFLVYRIIEVKEALSKETTCKHCGRSVKAIYHTDTPGNLEFEIVQTGGPDAPEWMKSRPRRIEEVK